MPSALFRDLTDVYEALVDWPKRLAHETPFYRDWFGRAGVRRVLDAACGTGRHAALFHDWGLAVEGADVSPAMIERARKTFGEPAGLRFTVRGFDAPVEASEPFDAAICVGNSLSLAPDFATIERTVAQMLGAVRPGGLLVTHTLNLWRMPDGPCVWQKCRHAFLPQGEVLIVKGVHRCGQRGYVDLVVAGSPDGNQRHAESTPFLGLEAAELEALARRCGAAEVACFGGYRGEPYVRETSVDLIMAVRKA